MPTFENLSSAQKVRVVLQHDVQSICKETCHMLGLEMSKSAMELVAELVYKKLSVYGTDLEAFAKHAKRSTINTEDVKLLVRRCPSLKSRLDVLAPATVSSKDKKRKTIAAGQSETPNSKSKDQELASKQKKPESNLVKQKLVENLATTSKEVETDKVDTMITDDLIDLTFD